MLSFKKFRKTVNEELLTETEKGILLMSARESIQGLFDNIAPPVVDFNFYPNLLKKTGAFVTLLNNNELRGCIGYITSDMTMFETVCQAAKLAASQDPRFYHVKPDELYHIIIEISILSEPVTLQDYNDIVIGKHGLIIQEGNNTGLLLPQVAVENKFNIEQFLTAICEKAGLKPDYWKTTFPNLQTFTATVFSESRNRKKTYEAY